MADQKHEVRVEERLKIKIGEYTNRYFLFGTSNLLPSSYLTQLKYWRETGIRNHRDFNVQTSSQTPV